VEIGPYSFTEFKGLAEKLHGYAAPGLLIGAYLVEKAKAFLPADTLFEAVVETKKCLPDAVQLLTLCSAGNSRMTVVHLGRFAVSLFDKYTGDGFRAHVDVSALEKWPEIRGWFLKTAKKEDQDAERLEREIEAAGDTLCAVAPIRIHPHFLGHAHMGRIAICPCCREAFPAIDGILCRGCQGEAPYFVPPFTSKKMPMDSCAEALLYE
jgi:formylmethanofuran dehydrogenase subunit E